MKLFRNLSLLISLLVGILADFIVTDRNIFDLPVAELYKIRVERTVLGGEVVYNSHE